MLVIKDKQALLLKLADPGPLLAAIPTARAKHYASASLVVVPHRIDEVRVLRNLGIAAPSPIEYHYKWSGRKKPFSHQRETAGFLTLHKKLLVLNEIGTGKTQSALWAADYLMKHGLVKKVLIVSPLSTLERVWGDAIFTEFPHRRAVTLHGSAERRKKLLQTNADFYIINHDGFGIIAPECIGMFDLVIVDEAAVLRNPQTRRYKTLKKWMASNPDTRLWLMTGTPTPNEPTDAWALGKLVDSPELTTSYTNFREQVMTKVGQWKWVARPNSAETVSRVLQPAIRFSRDECFDLPGTVVQTRQVDLTPEQTKHYNEMMKNLIAEVQSLHGGQISAANEAVKLQKLVQIACGVAYGEDGQAITMDASARVNTVLEIIEEAGGKIIVFVPLTGVLHMLEKEIGKHYTVGVVNGEVPSHKRNEIFHNFQNEQNPRVLLAHPATMAHGLTLTAASTIIWYGPINSNEQYTQANGRIERIGKHHVSNVVHIEASRVEHEMYRRLQDKQSLQGLLLDIIQGLPQ